MKKKIQTLTTVEEQLMHILWELNDFRLKDIMEVHPAPVPHQNTISTYLKILTEKGFIKSKKEGRILVYHTVIKKETYTDFLLNNFVEQYFKTTDAFIQYIEEKGWKAPQPEYTEKIEVPETPAVDQVMEAVDEAPSEKQKPKKKKKKKDKKSKEKKGKSK